MYIVYEGPSVIDGAPVVALVNGIQRPSSNEKTGPMAQAYILRQDMPPTAARREGADVSICGACPHRSGSCYVQLEQAVSNVYHSYKRGNYAPLAPAELAAVLNALHRPYRISAYGDPTAVPWEVWGETLKRLKVGHTGYVHGWRDCDPRFRKHFMASTDSPFERLDATAMGWRTFRVRAADEPRVAGERTCPASNEAGKQTQCAICLACNGESPWRSSITTVVHGSSARVNAFARLKGAAAA